MCKVQGSREGFAVTLGEFDKEHPIIALELRMFAGDWHSDRAVPRWLSGDSQEVTGVYAMYEEGVLTWYAMVQSPAGEDLAIYKDGKWAYTGDYWMH